MPTSWIERHGDAFRDIPVLVTGGAGFIGSHLSEALLTLGARVTVIDDLSNGFAENVPPGARWIHASILDRAALNEAVAGARYVFHQAALGSVPRSIERPEIYVDVNVRGTFEVLRACADMGIRRVLFAASSSAYGDTEQLPKHEDMPPLPRSPYAATKVAGEAMMRAWCHSYRLDTLCLRYFNVFGSRQNANSAYAAVIAAFAAALLAGKRPTIYGDGSQSRDFTHVNNAVHANLLAARSPGRFEGQVANVACGTRVSVARLATLLAELIGRPDLKPQHKPMRNGDVLHSQAAIELAKTLIGYAPIANLHEGLQETVAWYRSQAPATAVA